MTNNTNNVGVLASVAKTLTAFLGSLFATSNSREFQRLKNFIAS